MGGINYLRQLNKINQWLNLMKKGMNSYCNNDKCPDNKIGTLRRYVDDRENNEFDMYVPKDNESIVIEFG